MTLNGRARGGAKRGSVSGSRGESQDGGTDGEIGEEKSAKVVGFVVE